MILCEGNELSKERYIYVYSSTKTIQSTSDELNNKIEGK